MSFNVLCVYSNDSYSDTCQHIIAYKSRKDIRTNTNRHTVATGCQMKDLAILMDTSGSFATGQQISPFRAMRRFAKNLIGRLDSGWDSEALVHFSEKAEVVFNFTTFSTKEEMYQAIDNILQFNENTDIAMGLRCSRCNSGYNLDNNGNCVAQCNVPNCQQCQALNRCSQCNSGYSLDSNGLCVPQCIVPNCQQCQTPNKCSQCNGGYNLDSNGNCVSQCNIPNCQQCQSPDRCSQCRSGYSLDANGNCVVQCNVANCFLCNTPNVCAVCNTGFTLNIQNNRCDVVNSYFQCKQHSATFQIVKPVRHPTDVLNVTV
ncbi:hypothetical protein HELRODRAFT_183411, partial [Helobdella robusta]|uniref:VWFA domain-containing protein n=1 Tax=Helobdella robusta TaxID=6412 RepID=T1FJL3_HELRO